ncbi:hypothetical protein TgHK011_006923 [Trichoderma gracile]|nr:hypothetical protein TgHK011_006923 [Trichoderma gracile]
MFTAATPFDLVPPDFTSSQELLMSVKAVPATLHLLELPESPSASYFDARQLPATPTVALASITTTTTTIAISKRAAPRTSLCAA